MKLGEKNKHKSWMCDWHNQTESALFWGSRGVVNSEKLRYF